MKRRPRRGLVVPLTIGLVLGLGGGALAAFSATTTDGANRFVAAADWEPPHVTRTAVAKTVGYLAGAIRQGGQFYVYAQIDDGGNPPIGVGPVTVNVSAFSTGGAAVAMVPGAFSERGVLYNYRSAARAAMNPMANGTRTYSFSMADLAVPAHSQTQTGFTVIIDNTGPAPVNMTSANRAGGTVGRAEQGDSITYTWNEPIDPESLLPGWDGGSPTTVTVRITNNGNNDRVRVRGPAGNLNFGTVRLQQNYVPAARDFTGSAITMLGNTVTIVLGTPNGATNLVTAPTATTWQADSGAYDAAGNTCSNVTITGSGSPRIDF
ncbi:MAG: hypothetical protein ACXWDU_10055 [Actinomycetota bacterium]